MTCSQCTGRCLGPAVATQSRSVSCKHFSNSTSKTCDPKERCQCYAVFSITHSHMHSSVNVLFLLIWFSNTFRPSPVRNCSSEMCDVHWKVFPWRTCTAACGSGFQSRRVECIHRQNKKTLPDQHCAWQRRPSTWQHCNITSCGSESLKTPCYKPERQYGSGNVCPSEHSWFIRENIRNLVPSLSKSKLSQRPKRTGSRSQGFLFLILLSSVISGILSVQTSAFCSSLFCGET